MKTINKIKLNCDTCGKSFEKWPSQLNKYKNFCSKKCKTTGITLKCETCKKSFKRDLNQVKAYKKHYCSKECRKKQVNCVCENCSKKFTKPLWHFKKVKHHFCNKKCANAFNKNNWNSRSKLEIYLEENLLKLFQNTTFMFNDRLICGGLELDIYIPELNLAFEINGPFHYEPIFGKEHLLDRQKKDSNKMSICLSKKIDLCILDVSSMRYFKENKAKEFLEIIKSIISRR